MSEDRKEYMKQYNELNKERINERNRRNYLKRKAKKQKLQREQEKQVEADKQLLKWIEQRKKERINNMSPVRLRRREQLQQAIFNELNVRF